MSEQGIRFAMHQIRLPLAEQKDVVEDIDDPSSRPDVLRRAIYEKPVIQSRGEWRIGEVHTVREPGYVFQLGKITKETRPDFDADDLKFIDDEQSDVQVTIVVMDVEMSICGIARMADMKPSIDVVARKLDRLLNSTESVKASPYQVDVTLQPDTREFAQRVRDLGTLTDLWVTVEKPNAYTGDELVDAMETAVKEHDAKSSSNRMHGDELRKERSIQTANRATRDGGKVTARSKDEDGDEVFIKTEDAPASFKADKPDDTQTRRLAVIALREAWDRLYGDDSG